MYSAVAGAAIGAASSMFGAKDEAKRIKAQTAANRLASKYKYSATMDSVNLMKAATREAASNAIAEQLRAGAETNREVKAEVERATSTKMAQSEGLTSGRSKGREMVDTMVKGNKLRQQMQNKTTSAVNQIVEAQDAKTNELNNRALASYQEMSAVLANEGPDMGSNVGGFLSGAMSGAASGMSLQNSLTA